ncbi:MAG: adenylyl-sulfate kinase, partial [Deltaproteobacteria bacterium]|nr:adenylyl-sulfate kinase [Deltaproteobacteria bacterium]
MEENANRLVIWLTGLSGAGKSTLATRITATLRKQGLNCLILDGDEIRKRLHPHLGFTRADILDHNRRIIHYCSEQIPHYDCIIVAVIAPFHEIRRMAREALGGNYVEVYVECSLEEVIRRDVKGLYQKALH